MDFQVVRANEPSLPDDDGNPVQSLERAERVGYLQRELDALRPSYCRLLVLRDLEGRSYEEIASLLGMPVGSVKGRLHRARRELVERLRASAYEWELPVRVEEPRLDLAA